MADTRRMEGQRALVTGSDTGIGRGVTLEMAPKAPIVEPERANFEFFLALPNPDRTKVKSDVKSTQFLQPLMEFSGACAGCGETPYLKLLTQLFGDRAIIANATGCSSIFGANLPTTPYTVDAHGRGPAWANSLFEDNAEFGYGIRMAVDQHAARARALVASLKDRLPGGLADSILAAPQRTRDGHPDPARARRGTAAPSA